MKRIITLMLALCMLAPVTMTVCAQNSKQTEKALKRQLKEKKNSYKKGGWDIVGSRTLEVALARHYDRLEALGDDALEFPGESGPVKSKNTGIQMATNNAMISFAQSLGSTLKGRVVSKAEVSDAEIEEFKMAYERLVEQQLKNELELSYTVMRETKDGKYEVETVFITSNSRIKQIRNAAAQGALKERNLEGNKEFARAVAEAIVED